MNNSKKIQETPQTIQHQNLYYTQIQNSTEHGERLDYVNITPVGK